MPTSDDDSKTFEDLLRTSTVISSKAQAAREAAHASFRNWVAGSGPGPTFADLIELEQLEAADTGARRTIVRLLRGIFTR